MFQKVLQLALRHKVPASIIALVIIGGGYYGYGKLGNSSSRTQYITAIVQRGTLVVSVSASGQVSAFNQVDVKPKVSGDVVYVGVKTGQEVKAGTLITQLDATDAQKAVRDAEANLQSAKIALEKLKQPADALSVLQAENALIQAQQSKQNAQDDLAKAYDDGFNDVANAFIDLPGIMTGLNTILNGTAVNGGQDNTAVYYDMIKTYRQNADQFRDAALSSYQTARTAYDKNLQNYKNASRYSGRTVIDALISETYDTTKAISENIKNTKSFLDLVNDALTNNPQNSKPPASLATHESNLQTYTGTTNTHLGNLLNVKNTIKNDADAIVSSDRTIAEKTESLAKLKVGPDALDIQSSELSVTQRENALLDVKEKLAYYFIRAPFDGVIARLDIKKGDPVSTATILSTLITKQKIAEVSLNEVDVTKIKAGEKATITFDAMPDLSITGQVMEIDTVGTVTQGVVTYAVTIAFDTQDERVKPGMSASAAIITDTKQNALLVPNSAIKQQGETAYVEILTSDNQKARRQNVHAGLSNDTMTEIVSGLREGDHVVTQTIAPNVSQTPAPQGSGFRIPGIGAGGGRFNR